MEMTVAEALVRCLELEQVDRVFGYPGGAILPVYDVLYKNDQIKHILTRHEQGAALAACGYARATGKVGVCMATSGPGATNLVTGIANAYMDSIPLVCITGQVSTSQVGTDAFQEVDITGITLPIVKHNYLLKDPHQLPQVVKRAFHIAATGRPGPVLIDIPRDVQDVVIDFAYPDKVYLPGYKPTYEGHPGQISNAVKLIKNCSRPVIYAGGGIINSNASGALTKFAETIGAPVVTTLMGLGSIPGEHPLFMGMLGLHGARYANLAVTNCDLLIAVGARFDDRVTGKIAAFAPNAQIIHIDIDPAEISKNVPSHLPIVGDTTQVLRALLKKVKPKDNQDWLAQIQRWKQQNPLDYPRDGKLKPQYVIEQMYQYTKGNVVLATDVGQHQMWAAHYFKVNGPRSFVTSGGLGCMGFGLPGAIGAQFGRPDQTVVLVTGDGSIQMTMNELGTAAEHQLPLKIFILNNHCLGMVRQLQEFYFDKRYIAVNLPFDLDFAALAPLYGMRGYTVTNEHQLAAVLPQVFDQPGGVIVNCLVDPAENVMPMVMAGQGIGD
ncbi:biosynthetic-type acetolactate synthase large subunit [Peptococcaceae bacterium 1198_IL3148]